MSQAKQDGQGVVVLWVSGTAGGAPVTPDDKTRHVMLQADITAGKDNRQLAGPLGVKAFPCIQVKYTVDSHSKRIYGGHTKGRLYRIVACKGRI